MSELRRQTLDFLRVTSGAPWKWEDGGKVLVWSDGTTIGFREEVNAIIERLADRGLPSFDSIALLLAACRGKLMSSNSEKSASPQLAFTRVLLARGQQKGSIELSKLGEIPDVWIKSPTGKAFLAEAIFEDSPVRVSGAAISSGLNEDFTDDALNTPGPGAPPFDLAKTTWTVVKGLERHTVESLFQRHKTGLDSLPKKLDPISLPANKQARRLLSELSRSDDNATLAFVARELMAGIRLPALASDEDELVLGGSAGLGNRGDLDRLLLSELAHDDETLATRVALNEALYIHREPPVLKPDRSLTIVIDSGLRMWGIPRVIAVSGALALIASHRGKGTVTVTRPEGNSLREVDLLSRDGLIAHLAELRTELDPRRALPALQASLSSDGNGDVVVITHRQALDDLGLQGQLAAAHLGRAFLLLIDNHGRVQLHPLPWGAPRPLSEVQIDLSKLLDAPTPKATPSLVDEKRSNDVPSIFREPRFPLLLSAHTKMDKVHQTPEGGIGVTCDHRLLQWKRRFGAEQLLADLPGGKTCWVNRDAEGRTIILKGRSGNGKMAMIVLEPNSTIPRITQFTGPQTASGVYLDHGALLVVLNTRVVAISIDTGDVLAEAEFPANMQLISGRYFHSTAGISFASWNGASVQWHETHWRRPLEKSEISLAFDRDGVGVWVVFKSGEIFGPTGEKIMETGWPIAHIRTTGNSDILVATKAGAKNERHAIYLKVKKTVQWATDHSADNLFQSIAPNRAIQNRFDAIYVHPGGTLRLRKNKGAWLEIFPTPTSLRLAKAVGTEQDSDLDQRPFKGISAAKSLGCALQVAEWPCGSKAWLDSRGLLHLRSHDPSILELTLTLNQGDMSAWTSDGQCSGIPFFTGKNQSTTMEPAAAVLKSFCDRIC